MPLAIDFSDIPSLDPLPEGTYLAEIVHAEEGTSQAGNPKIDLRWKVSVGEYEGRVIFDNLTFAPSSLWRVKQVLQAIGFESDFSGQIDTEDLLGQSALVTVSLEKGRTNSVTGEPYPDRNRVLRVKSADLSADALLG